MKIESRRIVVDGVEVGAIDVRPAPAGISPGPIEVTLAFRPNWVGVWKWMAIANGKAD